MAKKSYEQQVCAILVQYKLYAVLADLVWKYARVDCNECGNVVPFQTNEPTTFVWFSRHSKRIGITHLECLNFSLCGAVRGPPWLDVPTFHALTQQARDAAREVLQLWIKCTRWGWGRNAAFDAEDWCLKSVMRCIDKPKRKRKTRRVC